MSFVAQQQSWQALAETDPMWAVLSSPEKRGGKWDEAEFYASGGQELAEEMRRVRSLGLRLGDKKALDVGCGPGRITHALAGHFKEVVGYDISPQMLELARGTAWDNETFVLNETDDLSPFGDESFDFVYCSKVLQHVDPEAVGNYMAEMVRVLKRGGILFLQMLSHPTGWQGTKESSPPPGSPAYTVCTVSIDAMMLAFIHMGVIIHQARLVEKGEGQSLFSYDYIVERRGDLPAQSFTFEQHGPHEGNW